MTETRRKDEKTGGEKGVKPQRYGLIPPEALDSLARVYGVGADKYADRNWEKGYPWSWSFDAMMRHAWAFWRGEDNDPETGQPHLAHVAWHAFAMLTYQRRKIGTDDRSQNS